MPNKKMNNCLIERERMFNEYADLFTKKEINKFVKNNYFSQKDVSFAIFFFQIADCSLNI